MGRHSNFYLYNGFNIFLTVGLVGNWTIDLVDNLFNKLSLALGGSGVDGEQLGLLVNLVLQTGLLVLFVMA